MLLLHFRSRWRALAASLERVLKLALEKNCEMATYHFIISTIYSTVPVNIGILTRTEQFWAKSALIRPAITIVQAHINQYLSFRDSKR